MLVPKADLVIVFSTALKKDTAAASRAQKAQDLLSEYERLIERLTQSGFITTSRADGTDTMLIFIQAKKERVEAELERESLSDFEHGILSEGQLGRAPPTSQLLTPASRLRLVHAILTTKPTPSSPNAYANLTLAGNHDFPRVRAFFAPHDIPFNLQWREKWNDRKHAVSIPLEELTQIRDHFGEAVAFYFAFLRFYFTSLFTPAVVGFAFWVLGLKFNPVYSVILVLWSVFFVEAWSLKEKELSVLWGTNGIHHVEKHRPQFTADRKRIDPVSGEEVGIFPWYLTLSRQLASIPVLLLWMLGLAALICFSYVLEVLLQEVYSGPFKLYFSLVPTVLVAGLVPQVIALWTSTAQKLTEWENHPVESAHSVSWILKVFALNFFVAYLALILTAYIYVRPSSQTLSLSSALESHPFLTLQIPFGAWIVPRILALLPGRFSLHAATNVAKFSINSGRLHSQIVALTLTGQVTAALSSLGVPIILRLLNREVTKVMEKRSTVKESVVDHEDEVAFLERIRFEATLPEFSLFNEYSQMVIQFGYIVMFSLIWPVAPIWSLVNNFFELRSDAFKLSISKRPIPVRVSTIGPWLDILGFLTWFASLTNASLAYLYQPRALTSFATPPMFLPSSNSTTMTNLFDASHRPTPSDPHSLSAIRSTLWTSLLIALATEHGYLLARGAMRYLLWRVIWKGSEAEISIKKAELALKKDEWERCKKGKEMEKREVAHDGEEEGVQDDHVFWEREDQGLDLIRSRTKED